MDNIIIVAPKAIITCNNKALIVQRVAWEKVAANQWEFVGGGLDFGETPEECLKREIMEEAGLEVSVGRVDIQ